MSARDGRRVARWVADRVRQVAPPVLGHWPAAWEIVEAPSARFLDALDRWERTGTVEDREATREAGAAVVRAWAEAAHRWEAAGRPRPLFAANASEAAEAAR